MNNGIPANLVLIIRFFEMLTTFLIIISFVKPLRSTRNYLRVTLFSLIVFSIAMIFVSSINFSIPRVFIDIIFITFFINGPNITILKKIEIYLTVFFIDALAEGIAKAITFKLIAIDHITDTVNGSLFLIINLSIFSLILLGFVIAGYYTMRWLQVKLNFNDPKISHIFSASIIVLVILFLVIVYLSTFLTKEPIILIIDFLITIIITALIGFAAYFYVTKYLKQLKLTQQLAQAENNALYLTELQKNYNELRAFKHDYKNLLLTLSVILKEHQTDEATELVAKFLKSDNQATQRIDIYTANLARITDPIIRGLVLSKIIALQNDQIVFDLEVSQPIEKLATDDTDLIRILGILFDNAIEAAAQSEKPVIRLTILKSDQGTDITLMNTTDERSINLSQITKWGYSTKLNHTGLGLATVQKLCHKSKFMIRYQLKAHQFSATLSLPQKVWYPYYSWKQT